MSSTQYVDINRTLQNLEDSQIQPENVEAIRDFVNHCAAEGISEVRQARLTSALKSVLNNFAPDGFLLREASEQELKQVIAALNRSDYADSTKHTFKSAVKKFYKVDNGGHEHPEKVQFFSVSSGEKSTSVTREDLFTEEELKRLFQSFSSTRDRALTMVLYESGARPGELLACNIADFTSNGKGDFTAQIDNIKVTESEVQESTPQEINLDIEDPRLVQVVENTRYDEADNFNTYNEDQINDATKFYDDPDSYVAEKATAIVFDVSGSPSRSQLPTQVEFELRTDNISDTVTFSDDVIVSAAQDQHTPLGEAEDAGELTGYPTFELDPTTSEVEVNLITPNANISNQTEPSRDIVEMPELNIGFAGVQGDNVAYSGLNENNYDNFVEEAARLFEAMYPTRRVNVVKADLSERYHSGSLDTQNVARTNTSNGNEVRDIIEDAITDSLTWFGLASDDDSFADVYAIINGQRNNSPTVDDINQIDVAIAVVPNDYFEEVTGNPNSSTTGIHYSGNNTQPPAAGLVEIGSPSSAPHEAGHHLLGHTFYPSVAAQNNGSDTAHADVDLQSTKYDLTLSSFESRTSSPSYMSYGSNEWMDTLAYNEMLDDNISPTPRLGSDFDFLEGIFAAGEVTEDGIQIVSRSITRQLPATDVEGTNVTATVHGVDGEVLSERGFERGANPAADGGGDFDPADNLVFGTVPFPEDATIVEISAPKPGGEDSEIVSTTVNPYVDTMRETIFAIPRDAISIDYSGFKNSISNRLDTADRHIAEHRYRPAANVLESVDKMIKQHVESGYDTAPSDVRPKSKIRSMLKFRIDRLRRLAKQNNKGGNGKGKGQG